MVQAYDKYGSSIFIAYINEALNQHQDLSKLEKLVPGSMNERLIHNFDVMTRGRCEG